MTGSTAEAAAIWWRSSLVRLYQVLTRGDSVQPVDLLIVMAGGMERKYFALELYRAGVAPKLLLSVGRFEVSRMRNLGWEGDDELIALRDRLQPEDRHFFATLDASGTHIEQIALPRWSTYGEALGLRHFLQNEKAHRVAVVSTDVHLRRVALTFAAVFRDAPFEFLYWPVPARFGLLRRDDWWILAANRKFVVKEMAKLLGYRIILSTPQWLRRRLMRLKR